MLQAKHENSIQKTAHEATAAPAQTTLNWSRFAAALALVLVGAFLRLIPHPWGFTPIAAMALFGGATFARRELGLVLPLLALFLSDAILGFHDQMIAVYAAMALISCLGFWVKSSRTASRVAAASIAGSILFFLITNSAVWLTSGMYPKTASGWTVCLMEGLPFLQNSVAGDLFFSGVFFGAWALMAKAAAQLKYS